VLDEATVAPLVPQRPLDAHKYKFGRVLVVAGSDRFVGAACLGSEAAARAGAGLVGVVSTEAVKRVLATRLPEATYPLTLAGLDDDPEAEGDRVAALLPEQAVLLLGPGIDRSEPVDRFVRRLLPANAGQGTPVPAVIDADALTLLAGWPGWWKSVGQDNVLTPHAGEMARLVASDTDLGEREGEAAWETARRAAARWRQVMVLKGPFTVVAEPGGRAWVYPHANPALATAGTGDVLAGLISGLLSQGLTALDAARLGVVVHALAARRVVERRGARTLIASDLPPEVPAVLSTLAADGRTP
jgi:NAD(P)H-hydrate epimerase